MQGGSQHFDEKNSNDVINYVQIRLYLILKLSPRNIQITFKGKIED